MKTARFSSFVFVALAMFAPPAAAQTPDGMTPSREGICDDLANATPGLYGLCVAMCEAQDCEGVYDPDTKEVKFIGSCNPSTPKLLANFRKLAGDEGATPPCIRVPCPCWTETEIDNVGGLNNGSLKDSCTDNGNTVTLFGFSTDGSGPELAYSLENGHGLECIYMGATPQGSDWRDELVGSEAFRTCQDSVRSQIAKRGLTCN